MSVDAFAKIAGFSASTLYRWFNGETNLEWSTCLKIEVATNRKIKAVTLITEKLRKS